MRGAAIGGYRSAGVRTLWVLLTVFVTGTRAAELPVEVRIQADEDAGPLNPLYRDFAQGGESNDPEYYAPVMEAFARLRPRMVRFDHPFTFFTAVTRIPDGFETDFTKLDRILDLFMGAGAEPMVCLSYVPAGLARGSEISPPDFAEWEELVFRTVRHLNGERGLGIRYWEVWNEPNLDGFWAGSREEYLELYAASCRGVLRADPYTHIGGAGLSGFDIPWIEALLDFATANGLPVDFISWHEYYAAVEDCVAHVLRAEEIAAARGFRPELVIDEWNVDAGLTPVNDDHRAAVHIADFVRQTLDTPLDYAPFFEIKDGWTADQVFWGRWGMFTWQNGPKANYFTFLFHSRLGDRRVRLLSSDPDVNGIATRRDDGLAFTFYNRAKERKTAELEIAGLPREATAWNWTRYLIDRWHSNPAGGSPAEPEKVETVFPLTVREGILSRDVVLPAQSVSLVELRPELWSTALVLEVSPRTGDRAHPATARFFVDIGNVGCVGGPLRVAAIEGRTDRGEPIRFGHLDLPLEVPHGSYAYPVETLIPELAEPADIFLTVRARAETGEEAAAAGCIRVPAALEIRMDPGRVVLPEGSTAAAVGLLLTSYRSEPIYTNLEWAWEPAGLRPLDVPGYVEVPGYSETEVEVRFELPSDAMGGNFVVRTAASALGGLGGRAEALLVRSAEIHEASAPITVDGDLSEWRQHAPLFAFGPTEAEIPDPPEGKAWMAWDRDRLYFAALVRDRVWTPKGSGVGIWEGDSIQLAFDPHWDPAPDRGYDEDDVEVGFALRDAGPESWCWYRQGAPNPGPFTDAEFAVVRVADTTVYEIAFPARSLLAPAFAEDSVLGVSILINDWDGPERRSVEWGSGIAAQKLPWQFRRVRLAK